MAIYKAFKWGNPGVVQGEIPSLIAQERYQYQFNKFVIFFFPVSQIVTSKSFDLLKYSAKKSRRKNSNNFFKMPKAVNVRVTTIGTN